MVMPFHLTWVYVIPQRWMQPVGFKTLWIQPVSTPFYTQLRIWRIALWLHILKLLTSLLSFLHVN